MANKCYKKKFTIDDLIVDDNPPEMSMACETGLHTLCMGFVFIKKMFATYTIPCECPECTATKLNHQDPPPQVPDL